MTTETIAIDMNTFTGSIPSGYELVEYETGTDPLDGCVLLGFDEVGMFDGEFKNPAYALCTVD